MDSLHSLGGSVVVMVAGALSNTKAPGTAARHFVQSFVLAPQAGCCHLKPVLTLSGLSASLKYDQVLSHPAPWPDTASAFTSPASRHPSQLR